MDKEEFGETLKKLKRKTRYVFRDKPFPEEEETSKIEFGPLILDLDCSKGSNE